MEFARRAGTLIGHGQGGDWPIAKRNKTFQRDGRNISSVRDIFFFALPISEPVW